MTAGALTAFSFTLGPDVFSQAQQQQPGMQQQQQQQPGMQQEQPGMEQFQGLRATDLQGSRVVNTEGERLGTIDDLAVKMEDGILSYAIVSAGGFLGIGGNLRPVPPEALQAREVAMGYEIVLDITQDQWDRAPTIEREQIHQLDQEIRGQQVYQFYGQDWEARQERITEFAAPDRERGTEFDQPHLEEHDQQRQIEQQLTQAMTQAGVDQQQAQQEAQRLAQQFSQDRPDQQEIEQELEQALTQAGVDQQQAQQEAQRLSQQVHQQIEFGAPDREQDMQQQPRAQPTPGPEQDDQAGFFEPEGLRQTNELNLASDLMDARIDDQRGEELGEISDLLVDLEQGRVGFALIKSQAGFWDMGDAEFAVSPRAFEVRENRLILNLTPQDLEVAQLLTQQQLSDQIEQQAQISADEARQSPEVFRYQDNGTAPGVFGEPGREREESPESPEPGPPAQQDGQQQAPGQY